TCGHARSHYSPRRPHHHRFPTRRSRRSTLGCCRVRSHEASVPDRESLAWPCPKHLRVGSGEVPELSNVHSGAVLPRNGKRRGLPGRILGCIQPVAYAAQKLACRCFAPKPPCHIFALHLRLHCETRFVIHDLEIVRAKPDEVRQVDGRRPLRHIHINAVSELLKESDHSAESCRRDAGQTKRCAPAVSAPPLLMVEAHLRRFH